MLSCGHGDHIVTTETVVEDLESKALDIVSILAVKEDYGDKIKFPFISMGPLPLHEHQESYRNLRPLQDLQDH